MRAMVLERAGERLRHRELPAPRPAAGQLLLGVEACGVCRTDLHIVDGELPDPKLPLVPGHQVVGTVVDVGDGVEISVGDRRGVAWLGSACGVCRYCITGAENLCDDARFTGYHLDGGFADLCLAGARFCLRLPDGYDAAQAAPLLCAGAIGHRALRLAGDPVTVGLYGFGAAAHIVTQVAAFEGRRVLGITRAGDVEAQSLALELGAAWAGTVEDMPEELDAAVIFAPAGDLVPAALRHVRKGGVVVCAGIHMSDIPSFPYELLWGERVLRSVANLTRRDGEDILELAPKIPIRTTVETFALEAANEALDRLRAGRVRGAAVLTTL